MGYSVGQSLVGEEDIKSYIKDIKITVPGDVIVKGDDVRNTHIDSILDNEKILDADPKSVLEIKDQILNSKMIVWNGPLGLYEDGFTEGTKELARLIAESDGYSVVGGGDTISAITDLGLLDSFSFISTGGGAMLQYLTDGTLVGLDTMDAKPFLQRLKFRLFKF
jgi:phosphoglycerate kinase